MTENPMLFWQYSQNDKGYSENTFLLHLQDIHKIKK
jgi:hypothetical protein